MKAFPYRLEIPAVDADAPQTNGGVDPETWGGILFEE
jgi:hypothetical protein